MKRVLSVFLFAAILLSMILVVPAYAAEPKDTILVSRTVEYLDGGSYFVIEVVQSAPKARSSQTDGYKSASFYNNSGVAVWTVEVHGRFTYTGSSAKADSASATVYRYSSDATTVSKNSYVSGASAYASATVKYLQVPTSKTVKLTCDKNGNLS